MQEHLINYLEKKVLIPLAKVWFHWIQFSAGIEKYQLFYTYVQKTLKIFIKGFILAKLETSSRQFG